MRSNTILYCQNFSSTVNFYKTVLLLPISHERDWFVEFQINPQAFVSVADASKASVGAIGGQGITLSFQEANLAETHKRLLDYSQQNKLGLAIGEIKQVWGSLSFFIFDPEGNRIEFWQ